MMEDSDILTLGWGCEPPVTGLSSLWPPSGEEFVTLDVGDAPKDSAEFATLEVAKERDRHYYNTSLDPVDVKLHQTLNQSMRLQDWDIMRLDTEPVVASLPLQAPPQPRLSLPAPTPIHAAPTTIVPVTALAPAPPPVSVAEFYVDNFHAPGLQYGSPAPSLAPQYSSVHAPVSHHHSTVTLQYSAHPGQQPDLGASYQQHSLPSLPTYQQQTIASHPTFAAAYSPFVTVADPKRHTVRSPVSGKFVQRGPQESKRQVSAPKERKRPGPKTKVPKEAEPKPPDEPEYDPEVIANAHLTMDDDYYKCSVCKMKFKQPGNARRHIITVHRNEKNHECVKCSARFGRKDKLKTHMMRNHGFSADDIKNTFKHSGQGRQRSSILVNRDNRKSTESSNSSDTDDSNPLNLKTSGKRGGAKHLGSSKRRKV